MQQDKYSQFQNRLAKVFAHRSKKARKEGVSCYRLYDLDLPEFPFAIDLYEDHVHVAEYKRNHTLTEDEHAQWLAQSCQCLAESLAVPLSNIHVKRREIISDRKQQYTRLQKSDQRMVVQEHGHKFLVNLDDYLDTGLFLDHRPTRQQIKPLCAKREVLNLFAYTGSFSVYAAAGGANRVTTVDLSHTYLDWARDNFALNNLPDTPHRFIAHDVMDWLLNEVAGQYDLIICDPPTFSNSKRMTGIFDIQRDHPTLINQCLRVLRPNGTLYFSTNNKRFRLFDEHIKTKAIRNLTRSTTGFDYEGKQDRLCFELRQSH